MIAMRKRLLRIVGATVLLAGALLVGEGTWPGIALFLASYLLAGYDVLLSAIHGLARGMAISESFLMSIATLGALCIGEYPEGVLVMLLYQIGEQFQRYAVDRSRKSIAALMDIRPDTATVRRGGAWVTLRPDDVLTGETIMVKPGQRVPLDATITDGTSTLDTAALTGEPMPRAVQPGGELLSGCINLTGVLTATVEKPYGESTVQKILEMVENAIAKKSASERFITKFARVYTPIVVALAALLAFAMPLITGGAFSVWLYRALSFLVVSCPCALVISVPLSFFGGIGGASRKGILVKGGTDLESLAKAKTIVFDKTGTLTRGVFEVQAVHPDGMDGASLLDLTAHAQSGSDHPISLSLRRAYGAPVDPARVTDLFETPGHGVRATVDGRLVLAGNAKLMAAAKVEYPQDECTGTIVHVAIDGQYAGHIVIADALKPDAGEAVQALRVEGIDTLAMFTGDTREAGESIAKALGLDLAFTELLPEGKVRQMEALLSRAAPGGMLVFVGDGINDAPVLARADVGVAMGALGSDAAIEAADVVIMTDEPSKVALAIGIAKRTVRIANENIAFALAVKAIVLLLSALGLTTMLLAVFADVGVTVLAVLNAMRAMK